MFQKVGQSGSISSIRRRHLAHFNSISLTRCVADDLDMASAERFSHLLDVLSIASGGDDKIRFAESYIDEDRL